MIKLGRPACRLLFRQVVQPSGSVAVTPRHISRSLTGAPRGLVVRGFSYTPTRISGRPGTVSGGRDIPGKGKEDGKPTVQGGVKEWQEVISSFAKDGKYERVLQLLVEMRENGLKPNLDIFNIAIRTCGIADQHEKQLELVDQMLASDIQPDLATFYSVISACGEAGKYEQALELFESMRAIGIEPDDKIFSAIIDAVAMGGKYELAMELLDEMKASGCFPNELTYTGIIDACAMAGRHELALKLLSEMRENGYKANIVVYDAILYACSQAKEFETVLQLLNEMKEDGVEPNEVSYRMAIDAMDALDWLEDADDLYSQAASSGILKHWREVGEVLDLHDFTEATAKAALRHVLDVEKITGSIEIITGSGRGTEHGVSAVKSTVMSYLASSEFPDVSVKELESNPGRLVMTIS